MSDDLLEFDKIPCYFFNTAPPLTSRVYFKQKTLWEMLMYGALMCPYQPPQYTVFPGALGRWTMHWDNDKVKQQLEEIRLGAQWRNIKQDLIELMPSMLVRYHDWDTNRKTVWELTNVILRRNNENHLRLAVWPD